MGMYGPNCLWYQVSQNSKSSVRDMIFTVICCAEESQILMSFEFTFGLSGFLIFLSSSQLVYLLSLALEFGLILIDVLL